MQALEFRACDKLRIYLPNEETTLSTSAVLLAAKPGCSLRTRPTKDKQARSGSVTGAIGQGADGAGRTLGIFSFFRFHREVCFA